MFYNYYGSFQAKKAAKAEKQEEPKEEMEQPERPSTPVPSQTILTVPTPPSRVEKSEEKPVVADKENTPPVTETNEDVSTSKTETQDDSKPDPSCSKCLKRRLTDVQSPPNSTSLRECSPNKRPKHDTDSNNNSDSEDVSSSPQCHEPMQTEQISNLVNRFNSGLSSLLGSSPSHADSSDSLVSSCSTQISSFSESLGSRPVIALTV